MNFEIKVRPDGVGGTIYMITIPLPNHDYHWYTSVTRHKNGELTWGIHQMGEKRPVTELATWIGALGKAMRIITNLQAGHSYDFQL